MQTKHKLKAFTIMELLVSMTLTGILVSFAFLGYNQIQKLFLNYVEQSEFISEYNQLNKALVTISERAQFIEQANENDVSFKTDSNDIALNITKENILLKFKSHTDTFHLANKEKRFQFVTIDNYTSTKLVKSFECDVFFRSQKFRVSFHKQYDSESILKYTIEQFPPDELY